MNTRFSRNTLASAIALAALQFSSGFAAAQDALSSVGRGGDNNW